MATAKLGQVASNQISDLAQLHFDVDMKIRDILGTASLDVKRRLLSRLPTVVNDIENEMKQMEMPTA